MLNDQHGKAQRAHSTPDRPVVEVVVLALREATADEFAEVLSRAIKYICLAPGYLSHSFGPCSEEPKKYLLLVWWQTIDAHIVDFRQSENHALWRSVLQIHLDSEPWVRHFEVSEGVGIDRELQVHESGNSLNRFPLFGT